MCLVDLDSRYQIMKLSIVTSFVLVMFVILHIVNGTSEEENSESSYSEEKEEAPRVRIKVFRGPMEEENGEKFAPWGFWIKQPAARY